MTEIRPRMLPPSEDPPESAQFDGCSEFVIGYKSGERPAIVYKSYGRWRISGPGNETAIDGWVNIPDALPPEPEPRTWVERACAAVNLIARRTSSRWIDRNEVLAALRSLPAEEPDEAVRLLRELSDAVDGHWPDCPSCSLPLKRAKTYLAARQPGGTA